MILAALLVFGLSTPGLAEPKATTPPNAEALRMGRADGNVLKDRAVLRVSGVIDRFMREDLERFLKSLKPEVSVLELEFNSPGGSVDEGKVMAALLRERRSQGLRLIATVANGATCASMCVPIYVQAEVRRAGPASVFMFHAAHTSLLGIVNFTQSELTDEMIQGFRDAGVDGGWLEKIRGEGAFDSPQGYWLSGREMVDEKSNVVTELLPRHDKRKSKTLGGVKIWF